MSRDLQSIRKNKSVRATKNETLNQLEEFEKMLKNMQSGDITLLNAAQKAQLVQIFFFLQSRG